jgi:prevent-host-death family protein
MCYATGMRTIPQRELRNQIARVLRQVEAGERLRVTVDGRPVADLVPIGDTRRAFVPGKEVARLLADAPLDPGFADDLQSATGATVEEL